jgi:hypothetical protein
MVAPYDVQFMKSSCCSDTLKVDGIRSGLLHSQPRASKLRLDFEERGGSAVPAQRNHSTRPMHRVKVACEGQSAPTKATDHDVAAAAAVDAQQQNDTNLFVRVGLGRADAVSPIDCDRSSSAAEGSLSPFISRNAAIIDHFKLVKRPYSRRSTRADCALGYSRPGFCLYSEKRAASAHYRRNTVRTRRDTVPEGFHSSRGSTIDNSTSGTQQQQQSPQLSPQQYSHRSERPHRREHTSRERPRTSLRDGSGSSRVAVASTEAAAVALAAAAER